MHEESLVHRAGREEERGGPGRGAGVEGAQQSLDVWTMQTYGVGWLVELSDPGPGLFLTCSYVPAFLGINGWQQSPLPNTWATQFSQSTVSDTSPQPAHPPPPRRSLQH